MLIAKDLMTVRPMMLYSSDNLEAAVKKISDYKVSSALVLTPDGEILGVLTENILLRLFLNRTGRMDTLIKYQKNFLAAECIFDREPASKVLQMMRNSESGRLWVLDSQSHIVGVISPKDVFQLLKGEPRSAEPMFDELSRLKSKLKDTSALAERTSARLIRLESLINGSTYMMHSVDKDGNIILANRRLHEVLEYNYGELVGKSIEDLYGPEIGAIARDQLSRIVEGKEQDVIRTSFLRKTGGLVRVEIVSSAVKDRDGNFVATSSMSRLIDTDSLVKES